MGENKKMIQHDSGNETVLQQRHQLMQIARGYRAAQILFTCVELDVFETIAASAHTANEIATALQTDARGTELLLNTAVALGWLEKRDNCFYNAPIAQTCLVRGGAGSLR